MLTKAWSVSRSDGKKMAELPLSLRKPRARGFRVGHAFQLCSGLEPSPGIWGETSPPPPLDSAGQAGFGFPLRFRNAHHFAPLRPIGKRRPSGLGAAATLAHMVEGCSLRFGACLVGPRAEKLETGSADERARGGQT